MQNRRFFLRKALLKIGHRPPMPEYSSYSKGNYENRNESNKPGIRWQREPPRVPFQNSDHKENSRKHKSIVKLIRQTSDLLFNGLSGDAERRESNR